MFFGAALRSAFSLIFHVFFEAKTLIHSGDTIGTPANADLMAFTVRTLGRTVKDPFVPTTGNMQIVAFLWKVFVTRTLTKREKRIGYLK